MPHIDMADDDDDDDDDDDNNNGSVANGKISPFHVQEFPQGHGPTNFGKWITASHPYQIKYKPRFEPYFVVNKKEGLPPFWEYFQGYGFNKWSWVAELHVSGWTFVVAPNSFLVRINHDYSTNDSSRIKSDNMVKEFALGFVPYIKKEYGSNPMDNLSDSSSIMDTLIELGYLANSGFKNDHWDALDNKAQKAATLLGFTKNFGMEMITYQFTQLPLMK